MSHKAHWTNLEFSKSYNLVTTTNIKIKQRDYLNAGQFPVVDQGSELIGGYYNNQDFVINAEPPFIIFGDHTKVIKYIDFRFIPGADGVKVLKPCPFFSPKLFYYFLKQIPLPDKGYARHFQHLAKEHIPLPPLPEQRAIVAKLETLLSELDNAVASLKQAKEQINTYRQSVLKAAFTGKLTEAWRKKQTDLPNAETMCNAINEEHERNYQSLLNDYIRDKSKEKPLLPKIVKLNKAKHSEINYWLFLDFENSCKSLSLTNKKIKQKDYLKDGKYPVVDQGIELIGGYYDNGSYLVSDVPPYIVFGDHTKVVKYLDERFVPGADGIKVLKPDSIFNPKLFYYFLQMIPLPDKGYARHYQYLEKSSIPYPSKSEQDKIVEIVELLFDYADNLDNSINESVIKSDALKQSLLKQAFEGKLLTEEESEATRKEPDWEPADKLFERIKQSKSGH
jgi:type I restriction enzyme S subunit